MNITKKIKLNQEEKIVGIVQRYALTFFWHWIAVLILLSAPFFFMFWLFAHGWWGQTIFFVCVGAGLFWLLRTIFIWQKNALIVTSERIIDIDQRGFFEKIISDIELGDVEDVAGKIKGFWGTIFKYGTAIIEADEGRIEIIAEKIKHPDSLQKFIKNLRKEYITEHAKKLSGDIVMAVTEKLHELELTELEELEKVIQKRIIRLKKREISE